MKYKYYLHLIPLVFITTSQSWAVSYSFDGTLSDHFDDVSTQTGVVFDQSGAGTLFYHNNNTDVGAEVFSSKENTSFSPLYSQSWDASIKVSLPTNYSGDPFIGIGFNASGGGGTLSLSLNEDGERTVFGESGSAENDISTLNEMVTLRFNFDSATKILTGSADGLGTVLAVDTDDPSSNWNMTNSSIFIFDLVAAHSGVDLPSSNAPFFDDFNGSIVPEPSSLALLGLGGLALMSRRRRA